LLADSGYAGQPVTCLAAQDIPQFKVWGEVTADLLKRLGMKVDYAAVDIGTTNARMAQKKPPGQGGWQVAPNGNFGVTYIDPSSNVWWLSGNFGFNGWGGACDPSGQQPGKYRHDGTRLEAGGTLH
jgi:peptide/nickel transport system substrate-binding protein